jgi:protein-disulfide isomerase
LGVCVLLVTLVAAVVRGEPLDPLVRDDGRTRGSPKAPVTLIEYSDFTCGYCLKFFHETWPRLRAKYVETGKVRFLYRDYPRADRGPGLEAAIAARCAGEQGQYWSMHDRLFNSGGRLDTAAFQGHAKAIGLDQASFFKCLQGTRYTKSIFQDREQGVSLGFRGTPGFLLLRTDGDPKAPALVVPGAFPYEFFEEQIERLLAAPASTENS